jgi:hypothetical protein
MQKLTDDLAAPWFLELWAIASTPAKAIRLRKPTVERLLKQHRIRRMDAETALRILREPAIKVAEGVAEAASIHMRSLVARLRIVNRELRETERKLDEFCTVISEIEQTSGDGLQRRDVAILRSMPGIGRINLGTLLSEASGPLSRRDYEGLRTLSGARRHRPARDRIATRLAGPRVGAFWKPGDPALISLPGPAWLGGR